MIWAVICGSPQACSPSSLGGCGSDAGALMSSGLFRKGSTQLWPGHQMLGP